MHITFFYYRLASASSYSFKRLMSVEMAFKNEKIVNYLKL